MYRLTRDDGAELRVNGGTWEQALELAYLYGWRPAGTEPPRTEDQHSRHAVPGTPAWDRTDYFSYASQHVGREDASALAEAVLRAMLSIHGEAPAEGEGEGVGGASASPIPSRASATAAGISAFARGTMRRFAAFADRGGFTIDSPS